MGSEMCIRDRPDVVIVATGGAAFVPTDIPGVDRSNVFTAIDVLAEKVRCGYRVVVLGANLIGCEVADWLGIRRKEVTIVKRRPGPQAAIGEDIPVSGKAVLLDRLPQWNVKIVTGFKQGVTIKQITDEGVVIVRDGQQEVLECDSVVLALGTVPVNGLFEQLKDEVAEIHIIGDAKLPARVGDAVLEGSKVARII